VREQKEKNESGKKATEYDGKSTLLL